MVYQREQYHLFSLPAELLINLTPRTLVNQPDAQEPTPPPTPPPNPENSRACNICLAASFANVDDQRTHFRSDWHRYNVKARLNGSKPVTQAEFATMLDALEDSLSGSESSTDAEGSESDAVNTLVNRTKRLHTRPESPTDDTPNTPRTAITWFHSPPSTQLGVYRAIFSTRDSTSSAQLDELREMQTSPPEGRKWALFMVAGGHFAASIVRVSPGQEDEESEDATAKKKKKLKQPKPDTEVLLHKTFHRYTTRRKQGGSQSTNDNSKSKAVSAGAMLRRYGEQALREDIRGLLTEWAEDIADCERIWIRASTANRKIFINYEDAVIDKADARLRTFPFPTRRPTQAEIARCLQELVRVKVSHFTEEELQAQDDAARAALPKPRPAPTPAPAPIEKPKAPKLSPEEEALRDKWIRLVDMITRGRLEPLQSFWAREGAGLGGPDAPIPAFANERARTILQLATREGQVDIVRWLLEDADADPTVPADEGRAAYDLARTREVRDVFRRAAGDRPGRWDWLGAAHVPSALSREAEDAKEEKRRVRRKGLKDKIKEREAREKKPGDEPMEAEPLPEPEPVRAEPKAGPRKLGGTAGAAEGITGLTPEMRARVERERRARAAEARLRGIGG
ncbi:hypothetical protein BD626DRAFT_628475 [Schizophyllum amplum]|uniref:VLRF1 domain-containing protein n=1 Tax=Schizophyllum amplum TaxID=97359 RepID=A0A550CKE9_9AGAR|nr:hypothetical protein BD626DRAFT_628475 [Auriculariopsis ampla]